MPELNYTKVIRFSIWVTAGLFVIKGVVGIFINSLTIIADAAFAFISVAHEVLLLMPSWGRTDQKTIQHSSTLFQLKTFMVLAGALVMAMIGGYIIFLAWYRLNNPFPVPGIPLLVIAFVGIIFSLFKLKLVREQPGKGSLSQAIHSRLWLDLVSAAIVAATGMVVLYNGWMRIDAIAGILISILMLVRTVQFLIESVQIIANRKIP